MNRLQVGKTTKAEASQLFGSPMLTIELATWQHPRVHFGDENTAVIWRYAKGSGSLVGVNARMLQLSFDAEGRLTDYHFESTYKRDAAQHPAKEVDFDIFAARQGIVVGQSSRADVASLMGTNYVVMPFNKPGIAMRWHYGFSKKTKTEPAGRADKRVEATCGKSLEVDFDERGIVRHLQGESDFPGDVARDRSTSSTAPTGRP